MPYAKNTLPLSIEWAHCDPAGIVWNPRFFEFFDTGAWMLFQTVLGIPRATAYRRWEFARTWLYRELRT